MFKLNSLLIISFLIFGITSCSTPENKDSAIIEQNERSVEKKENTIEKKDSTRKEKCLIHPHKIILPNGVTISPLMEVTCHIVLGPVYRYKLLIESNSELEYMILRASDFKIIVDSSTNQPFLTRSVGVEIMDQEEITITVPSIESLTKYYIYLGTIRDSE
jgi:hypothetical protein